MTTVSQQMAKVIEENVKIQYTSNQFLSESDFKSLDINDRKQAVMEYALNEFVNTGKVVDVLFNGKKGEVEDYFDGVNVSLRNNTYFREIERSAGDITKTKHNGNVKSLLNYAVETNASNTYRSEGTAAFEESAAAILRCIKNFEVAAPRFKAIISAEATNLQSKKVGTSFYKMSVFLLQVTADILYSNSLKAEFDYNQKTPVANNVYFEYTTGVVDDMMSTIAYLNGAFANGKIFSALDSNLQESFRDAEEKIVLNEGIIDTIFGLVSHFKTLDILVLWPIYITRALAYWTMYFYATFKNVGLDIDESLALRKAKVVTKSSYDTYHANASHRGEKARQAFSRASVTLDMSAKADTKSLQNLQNSQSTVLI